MRSITKTVLIGTAIVQLATLGALGQIYYQLDHAGPGVPVSAFNASDGTEPLDNWVGNEFTALNGANLITRVDFGVHTVKLGTTAELALYRVANPGPGVGGGLTLLYTQNFTPISAISPTFVNLNQIPLTTPVLLNPGDEFVVSVLIRNVIALPPNDVYPFVIDNGTTSAGSFWDRSAPNTFNLNDLSGARLLTSTLAPDGSGAPLFSPGPGHLVLRAQGVPPGVPEPFTFALAGLGAAMLMIFRRRNK
jgi:hypothetical protein